MRLYSSLRIYFSYYSRIFGFAFLLLASHNAAQCQTLSAIDSASIWPRRVYVALDNVPFAIHQVQAQRTTQGANVASPVTVEIYNLLVPAAVARQLAYPNSRGELFVTGDTLLVTISVLPNKDGAVVWKPISLDTISARYMLSMTDVIRDGGQRIKEYRKAGKPKDHLLTSRINLFPIVQRQGRYWTPDAYVLTQYFIVQPLLTKSLALTDYVTINTKSPIVPVDATWRTIRALLPSKGNYEYSTAIGIVLEKTHQGMFEFWSRPQINVSHPGLRHFGIGSFEYKPGIGLVSGKYAQYFYELNPLDFQMNFDSVVIDGKVRLR